MLISKIEAITKRVIAVENKKDSTMTKEQFNSDYNAEFVQIDKDRTDFADQELGNERLFQLPYAAQQRLGGIGILQYNLDTLEVGDEL